MTGFNANNTNRFPLWEVGYDDSNPLYTYIRTLAWYRWWMELGNKTFTGETEGAGNLEKGKRLLVI
jgi:hypothetical protein